MRDKETPLQLVRLWPKISPGCYEALDYCYKAKEEGELRWPDYCPLPIGAAFSYLVDTEGLSLDGAAHLAAELTACWAWRQNKILYAYDPDLVSALKEQAEEVQDSDVLPADLLMHLPFPCVYIKAPGILDFVDGFFAWIEYDIDQGDTELRIQWMDIDMQHSFPQVLHIRHGWTLRECLNDTARRTAEVTNKEPDTRMESLMEEAKFLLCAMQLLLYIVSQNADIEDSAPPLKAQSGARFKKTVSVIQDKASEVKCKDVGVRIGSAIRKARVRYEQDGDVSTATTASKRAAHMRRGHWHHYWVGAKDSPDRSLVLRWTAPTFIHADEFAGDNIVAYPVKKD